MISGDEVLSSRNPSTTTSKGFKYHLLSFQLRFVKITLFLCLQINNQVHGVYNRHHAQVGINEMSQAPANPDKIHFALSERFCSEKPNHELAIYLMPWQMELNFSVTSIMIAAARHFNSVWLRCPNNGQMVVLAVAPLALAGGAQKPALNHFHSESFTISPVLRSQRIAGDAGKRGKQQEQQQMVCFCAFSTNILSRFWLPKWMFVSLVVAASA